MMLQTRGGLRVRPRIRHKSVSTNAEKPYISEQFPNGTLIAGIGLSISSARTMYAFGATLNKQQDHWPLRILQTNPKSPLGRNFGICNGASLLQYRRAASLGKIART